MRHSRLQHQATLSGEEHAVRCPRVSAGKAPAGAVVATDLASDDADYDNVTAALTVRLDSEGAIEARLIA